MTKIFRDFDQAALDAAYNNRAQVPDHGPMLDHWAASSAEVRSRLAHRADLACGPSSRQRVDFFPAARRDAPLFLFIHGGYWQALDHRSSSFLAPPVLDAGIAFASIGHDLCPQVGIGTIVEQIRQGFAWLWGRAQELGFDRRRIWVGGHSSGGHLATMLALTAFPQRGLPVDAVKGVLALSGLYELEPIRLSYLNATLKLDADAARTNSPACNLPAVAGPSFPSLLLAVGAAELPEYRRQQRDFAAACRSIGAKCRALELAGLHHFSVVDALAQPDHELSRAVRDMILRGDVV